MFSSEVDEVSSTESLSWLASSVSSELLAFIITHSMEAAFPRRLISAPPPTPPYLMNYDCNGVSLTLTIRSNLFWLLIIASDRFFEPPTPPHPTLASFVFIVIDQIMIRYDF